MDYKKVSVIVPVYNTEKYVEKCIRSILAQTYRNLEVICVDDGSTDQSAKILQELAQEDSRIKCFHISNHGQAYARNMALEKATGEYITFVDSDDYIENDMYEILVKEIQQKNVDIVCCNYFMDVSEKKYVVENTKQVPDCIISSNEFMKYIYERDNYRGVAGYLWTRLIKTDVIKSELNYMKIQFDNRFRNGQDILFVAELNLTTKYVYYVNKPLYHYVQREDSVVHSKKNILKTLQWVEAYEKVIQYYQEKEIDTEIIELIQRMYVYRCGKILEIAYEENDKEKVEILKQKIKDNLLIYVKTNMEHLDRVKWLISLIS